MAGKTGLPYTFKTVPVEQPPAFGPKVGLQVVDIQGTFLPVPENSGDQAELPVAGGLDVINNQEAVVLTANARGAFVMASQDAHDPDDNPTVASSYNGVPGMTWVTGATVQQWINEGRDFLKPTVNFTAVTLRDWANSLKAGGYMVWPPHSNPFNKLFHIHPRIYRALMANPRVQFLRKGQQPSKKFPGLCPECYSMMQLSTGEKLWTGAMLRANGVEIVVVIGDCGDFCAGETAIDAADEGFEVWLVVDAQVSVKAPNFAGTDMTSEEVMLERLINHPNVHFCTTADVLRVNGYQVA